MAQSATSKSMACGKLLLRSLAERCDSLSSAFGFAPSDDIGLATAYVAAGFRRTGLLAQGCQSGGDRKDAILWTRKLANPAGDVPEDA